MQCKPLSIKYVMYVYGLCLFYLIFATKNLNLATIFYHLVAKWRLNNFFNFEPCEVYHSQKREKGRDKQNVDDGHVLNSTF